jgi:formylglycine-generating enzyme required for sulfatase activity
MVAMWGEPVDGPVGALEAAALRMEAAEARGVAQDGWRDVHEASVAAVQAAQAGRLPACSVSGPDVPDDAFQRIQRGVFTMGSPAFDDNPRHRVQLTHDFELGRTEVTGSAYRIVSGHYPYRQRPACVDCPAVGMSWHQAAYFTHRLSGLYDLPSCYDCTGERAELSCTQITPPTACRGFRLPTEAEWEYAARAGTDHRFSGTDEPAWLCAYANVRDASQGGMPCHDGCSELTVPASYLPNAWGLYDMTGNVWEWTEDRYAVLGTDAVIDPQGPDHGDARVVRGGAFEDGAALLDVSLRDHFDVGTQGFSVGFRVARTLFEDSEPLRPLTEVLEKASEKVEQEKIPPMSRESVEEALERFDNDKGTSREARRKARREARQAAEEPAL